MYGFLCFLGEPLNFDLLFDIISLSFSLHSNLEDSLVQIF